MPLLPHRPALPARSGRTPLLTALALASCLAACGGGGGGGGDSSGSSGTGGGSGSGTPTITLTGVVARGAAVAGATVSAKCASGSGSATTGSNGAYSLSVSNGSLPCVLEAGSGSSALHSAATGTQANITPFTELLVAQLSAQSPAAWFGSVSASTLGSSVTTATVGSAQTAVRSTLTSAGVDLAGVGDLVSGTLVAASGGSGGNVYDLALDALATKLTSAGTTLATLTATVAGTAAGSSGTSSADESSDGATLPADLLLQPHATNCDALRSGVYRVIKFAPSPAAGTVATERIRLNAATLTLTNTANANDTWQWTAAGSCRYSDGNADITVSPAGIVVAKAYIGSDDDTVAASARGSWRLVVAIPEQTVALADLAGDWNYLNWQPSENDPQTFVVEAATLTLNASGAFTAYTCNTTIVSVNATCQGNQALPTLNAQGDGSYSMGNDTGQRLWAYRSGNGKILLVGLDSDGQPTFVTRKRTLALPAVGSSWTARNITVDRGEIAGDAVAVNAFAIASVDTSAQSYVRNTQSNGSTVSVPQTLQLNIGGSGYVHRAAATVTASDNSSANVREMYSLPLAGMGLSAYWLPSNASSGNNARFGISVKQP